MRFNGFIPVVDHQLLHRQQGVVTDQLVLVVHVIHHQLFSTQLLDHPEMGGIKGIMGNSLLFTQKKKVLFSSLGLVQHQVI